MGCTSILSHVFLLNLRINDLMDYPSGNIKSIPGKAYFTSSSHLTNPQFLCQLIRLSNEAQGGSQKGDAIKIQISCQFPDKTCKLLKFVFPFSLVPKPPLDGLNLPPPGLPGGNIQIRT